MSNKFFTKQETTVVILLFLFVFFITSLNMVGSLRRARDAQRKGDLGAITDALEKFKTEIGFFPPSENGKIKMCKGPNFDEVLVKVKEGKVFDYDLFVTGLRACEWGKDGLIDILDQTGQGYKYMATIPVDPKANKGLEYYYISSPQRFQIYTYLEGGENESGYDTKIVARKLSCGINTCSFGRSYAVPIEKEIKEYENELIQKK